MPVTQTIDRTYRELRQAVGPWRRSVLYRLGLALQAAGAADSDDSAQELMWNGAEVLEALGRASATMREVLELQGVDVAAVRGCLKVIDDKFELERRADAEAKWARAAKGFRGSIA